MFEFTKQTFSSAFQRISTAIKTEEASIVSEKAHCEDVERENGPVCGAGTEESGVPGSRQEETDPAPPPADLSDRLIEPWSAHQYSGAPPDESGTGKKEHTLAAIREEVSFSEEDSVGPTELISYTSDGGPLHNAAPDCPVSTLQQESSQSTG